MIRELGGVNTNGQMETSIQVNGITIKDQDKVNSIRPMDMYTLVNG